LLDQPGSLFCALHVAFGLPAQRPVACKSASPLTQESCHCENP
jgi:hypothetical protein